MLLELFSALLLFLIPYVLPDNGKWLCRLLVKQDDSCVFVTGCLTLKTTLLKIWQSTIAICKFFHWIVLNQILWFRRIPRLNTILCISHRALVSRDDLTPSHPDWPDGHMVFPRLPSQPGCGSSRCLTKVGGVGCHYRLISDLHQHIITYIYWLLYVHCILLFSINIMTTASNIWTLTFKSSV